MPPPAGPAVRPLRCLLNVPGPFYTCGNCLACGTPEEEAPELLAPLEGQNFTTYFVKQPETAEEVEHACLAIRVCCVDDLRYGGQDRAIIERLGNDPNVCDFVIRGGEVVFAEAGSPSVQRIWGMARGVWLLVAGFCVFIEVAFWSATNGRINGWGDIGLFAMLSAVALLALLHAMVLRWRAG